MTKISPKKQEGNRRHHLKKTFLRVLMCICVSVYSLKKPQPNNLIISKFPQPTLHTSNNVDKLNKSKSSGCKSFHLGAAVGMLVVLLLLPLSLAIDNSEFHHGGGGGGGGRLAAAAAVPVVAVDNNRGQKLLVKRVLTVA